MEQPPLPPAEGMAAVITDRRKVAGLSQNGLADASGIPPSTFVRRMRRNDWTLIELSAIANTLGTTLPSLINEQADRERAA